MSPTLVPFDLVDSAFAYDGEDGSQAAEDAVHPAHLDGEGLLRGVGRTVASRHRNVYYHLFGIWTALLQAELVQLVLDA